MPKTTQSQDPKAEAAVTVAEVAITDGEDQPSVADAKTPLPTREKVSPATLPVGATQGAQGAPPAPSKTKSKAKKGANAAPVKAKATAKNASHGNKSSRLPRKASSPKPVAVTAKKTAKTERKTAGRTEKTAKRTGAVGKVRKTAKKPTSAINMGELSDSYLRHLETTGKSKGTVFSYGIEVKTAVKYFGADTKVTSLTTKKVREYFESDAVTKNRKGKPKDEKTVAKTRRVLRLALTWLAEVGVLKEAPIPDIKAKQKVGT